MSYGTQIGILIGIITTALFTAIGLFVSQAKRPRITSTIFGWLCLAIVVVCTILALHIYKSSKIEAAGWLDEASVSSDVSNNHLEPVDTNIPDIPEQQTEGAIVESTPTPKNTEAIKDISGITTLEDSIYYDSQKNIYTYTPSVTGIYVFNVHGGSTSWIEITDKYDARVDASYDGSSPITLSAGEQYTITLSTTEPCSYSLSIGIPHEIKDISLESTISDNITYDGQVNVYTFTPSVSGVYVFSIHGGSTSWIEITDKYDAHVDSSYDESRPVTLSAGEQYTISVSTTRPCSYSLSIMN